MVTARKDARQALSASLIKALIAHGLVHCSGASAPVPRCRISWQTNGAAVPSIASTTSKTVICPAGRLSR